MGIWGERPTSRRRQRADDPAMDGGAVARPVPTGLPTRYRLGTVVGRGGSATVWSARDTRTGRDVVVKVVDGTRLPVDRFDAEVRALGRLVGEPGVVEVQAVGVASDGHPWLVEELVPGPSLADRLRTAPWTADLVARLVRDVAGALAAAHSAGVVHGDVAPANVLRRADGAFVLCDFGVAVLGGAAGPAPCTPSFAAPERRAGGPPTPAGDVYGLAVLAWFAATGGLPDDAPRAPEGLSRRLGAALVRALDPAPRRRPPAAVLARCAR